MKNMTIQIRWMMGMLVLLLAGCDKESDDMVLPEGNRCFGSRHRICTET